MLLGCVATIAGCGDDVETSTGSGGANSATAVGSNGAGGETGAPSSSGSSGGGAQGGGGGETTSTGGSSSSSAGVGGASDVDPTVDGPLAQGDVGPFTIVVAETGSSLSVIGAAPTAGGPYPLVIIGHGFQLPPSQYMGYARRLASHGFVALAPDFPAALTDPADHVRNARDLEGTADWAISAPELAGRVDPSRIGVMGHSLGGKVAVLAAAEDDRFLAVLGLDPVDSRPEPDPFPDFPGCENFGACCAVIEGEDRCPDASALAAGLGVPSAFLGETLDGASGVGGACAPTPDNYATFYAAAGAPSFEVTVAGAGHMSFLDDLASCGFTCSACQTPTADNATVNGLAKAYSAAFFLRYLDGREEMASWLDGADAQATWVGTSQATIASK